MKKGGDKMKKGHRNRLVKGIEDEAWHRARVKALDQGHTMGYLLSELLRLWVRGKVKIPKKDKLG